MSFKDLAIQVYSIGRLHRPGDILRGRIIRRTAPSTTPNCTLAIVFSRRVKTRISISHGIGQGSYTTQHHTRFQLFDSIGERLYTGSLHVPLEGPAQIWEFAIQIPLNSSPTSVIDQQGENLSKACFLSMDPSIIEKTALPGSFEAYGLDLSNNSRSESYVEYVLEALLVQQGRNDKPSRAVRPVGLQSLFPDRLCIFELQRHSHRGTISTYHLTPGMNDAHLSFKEKTHEFLKAGSVPQLSFSLQVDFPKIIQLENPLPLPFRVRVVPNRRQTNQGILLDGTPPLTGRIKAFKLVLNAHTEVIASEGRLSVLGSQATLKHYLVVFPSKSLRSSIVSFVTRVTRSQDREKISKYSEFSEVRSTPDEVSSEGEAGSGIGGVTESASKAPDSFDMESPAITIDETEVDSMIQPKSLRKLGQRGLAEYDEEKEQCTAQMERGKQSLLEHEHDEQISSTPIGKQSDYSILAKDRSHSTHEEPNASFATERKATSPIQFGNGAIVSHADEDRQDLHYDQPSLPERFVNKNKTSYDAGKSSNPTRTESHPSASSSRTGCSACHKNLADRLPVLPVKWDDEDNEPIDLGAVLDLKIGRRGPTTPGSRLGSSSMSSRHPCTIYPSFKTYYIRHTHTLEYTMAIQICHETIKFAGHSNVTVKGSSTS